MPSFHQVNGKWVDAVTGQAATPDQVRAIETKLGLSQVNTPTQALQKFAPSRLAGVAERNIPPILSQWGGGELGALAGGLAGGPPLALLGSMAGAGLGSIGAKHLPKQLGGNPDQSDLSAFAWGAIPEGLGRGAAYGYAKRQASKLAAHMAEQQAKFAELSEKTAGQLHGRFGESIIPKPTRQGVEQLGKMMGFKPFFDEPTSPLGQQETFETRDAILNPIQQRRTALGAPIGNAYSALDAAGSLTEQEAADLADAAQGVNDNLISPVSKAKPVFAKIKSYRPPAPTPEAGLDVSALLKNQNATLTNEQWEQIQGNKAVASDYKAPTFGELRELRQEVNQALQNAQGGDAYALGNLQQAIDEKLMPHLPANMQALRSQYYQFIKNYPWRDINKLRQAGTVNDLSKWMFDSKPNQIIEMVRSANPQQRAAYQRLYAQRLFQGIDFDAPADVQMKELAQKAKGEKKLITELYGNQSGRINKILNYPLAAKKSAEIWKRPSIQRQWTESFMAQAAKLNKIDQEAAEKGFADLLSSMSPDEREDFLNGIPGYQGAGNFSEEVLPLPEQRQIPGPQQALKQRTLEKANTPYSIPAHIMKWSIPWAIGSLLMGESFGVKYGAGSVAAGLTFKGTKAAYRWAANRGLAEIMSQANAALARGAYREASASVLSALALAGGRTIQNNVGQKNAAP